MVDFVMRDVMNNFFGTFPGVQNVMKDELDMRQPEY